MVMRMPMGVVCVAVVMVVRMAMAVCVVLVAVHLPIFVRMPVLRIGFAMSPWVFIENE